MRRGPIVALLMLMGCTPAPAHVEDPASVVVESPPPSPLSPAQAAEQAPARAPRPAPPPPRPARETTADERARARELFKNAVRAFDQGNFMEARQLFAQAYDIAPLPQVLYNLAMADLKDGDQQAACDHFRQWKASNPNPSLLQQAQTQFSMCPP